MNSAFDLLRITGLTAKKPAPKSPYAGFNRRMMAATIDSIIATVSVAPFVEFILHKFYREPEVDLGDIHQKIMDSGGQNATLILLRSLNSSGYAQWWLVDSFFQSAAYCLASAICWYFWSATPGKMLLRMKIVDATTQAPITLSQIYLRTFGYAVSGLFLFIGFFWIGVDKRRQGWHDKIANTVVITLPWLKRAKLGSEAADPSDSPAPSTAE